MATSRAHAVVADAAPPGRLRRCTNGARQVLATVVAIALGLMVAGPASALVEALYANGEVVLESPSRPLERLERGMAPAAFDWIETGPDGFAQLRLTGGTLITMRADARLRVTPVSVGDRELPAIDLRRGAVRVITLHAEGHDSGRTLVAVRRRDGVLLLGRADVEIHQPAATEARPSSIALREGAGAERTSRGETIVRPGPGRSGVAWNAGASPGPHSRGHGTADRQAPEGGSGAPPSAASVELPVGRGNAGATLAIDPGNRTPGMLLYGSTTIPDRSTRLVPIEPPDRGVLLNRVPGGLLLIRPR